MRTLSLLILLALLPRSLNAETVAPWAIRVGDRVLVNVHLQEADEARIMSSLAEGHEVRLTFEFRLYRESVGLFSFLGDRLLAEDQVVRSATFDLFEDRYLVREDRRVAAYREKTLFLDRFLQVEHHAMVIEPGPEDTYLMTRARIEYTRLDAPLSIVTLFVPTAATTDWQRLVVRAR